MKKRLVDADKLMERAKMNSVLVTVEHDHHDYGLTLGTLNKIVKECELSSAQPETHDKRAEMHACDCISRQAAIDAFENIDCSDGIGISALKCDVVEDAINAINALPPAQPGRMRGRWIYNSPVTMKCDQCGLVIKDWDWHRFKFCPNCDCDMRGEQDG